MRVDTTAVRDGNSVSVDSTRTMPNGKTIERDTDITRDGNTVTRDSTITLPNGKTISSSDTWTRGTDSDGDPIFIHDGRTMGPEGLTTRQSTLRRDGETGTRDGAI